jgi:hypothetical protein
MSKSVKKNMSAEDAKTLEQRAAELRAINAEERAELITEIRALCNRVPEHVINGSFDVAVYWKSLAYDALKAAGNPNVKLAWLRVCVSAMKDAALSPAQAAAVVEAERKARIERDREAKEAAKNPRKRAPARKAQAQQAGA